ncbi:TIM barrel protein [Halomonas sp. LBP4]|uniref:TIM barrel protein n=1 Tax=Halomonas sp. LBP4 TaxID=2044917 RepID=UPI000D772F31|nr:TIM barrel protein [Halomonas sp. LBP4]PXX94858.1 AP endonuclease [Halomonas sp. LBP4]
MSMRIASAPCCWGVDDVNNPHLPPWQKVLDEAAQAGYQGLELGPYGYLPPDKELLGKALDERSLKVVAGTIFDDLVDPANRDSLVKQTHEICAFLKQLPELPREPGQHYPAPYLVVIDHVHAERSRYAGHPDKAPRLKDDPWATMMGHIRTIAELARREYGIRAVIHPHAGGYIEFEDEILRLMEEIPYETAGLCLDTGHLHYSGMDPVTWIREHADRMDYLHFKDIEPKIFDEVMARQVDFFDACAQGVMCPIGKGIVDYDGIYRLLTEIDYRGYITIEQERDPRDADGSLADVTASLEYLKGQGFQASL